MHALQALLVCCCGLLLVSPGPTLAAAAPAAAAAAAEAAVVAPLRLTDLPNDAATQCSRPEVRSAFVQCLAGASRDCCGGLDEVFANVTSPSAWCLCIPQVLYMTIVRASSVGLDVMGLLRQCRNSDALSFRTQWADATPTACPNITFALSAADVLTQLGPDVVLASSGAGGSGGPAKWRWSNLLQFGTAMQAGPENQPVWRQMQGVTFAKFSYLVFLVLPVIFVALHAVLRALSRTYRALPPGDALVVCLHAVCALVFSVSLVPQTLMALSVLFKAWSGLHLASMQITLLLGVFMASRAVLYAVEASVRSVVRGRTWLLIVQHMALLLIVVIGLWCRSVAVVGLVLVLDLFACHEAPLYLAMVSYRLRGAGRLTQAVLRGGLVWYVLTRILQAVVLIYMIAGFAGMPAVRAAPEFIVAAVLCCVLMLLQGVSLFVWWRVDRKVSAARKGAGAAAGAKLSLPGDAAATGEGAVSPPAGGRVEMAAGRAGNNATAKHSEVL